MRHFLGRFRRDHSGATAIEYGLIAALVFLVILASVTAFGAKTGTMYEAIKTAIVSAIG